MPGRERSSDCLGRSFIRVVEVFVVPSCVDPPDDGVRVQSVPSDGVGMLLDWRSGCCDSPHPSLSRTIFRRLVLVCSLTCLRDVQIQHSCFLGGESLSSNLFLCTRWSQLTKKRTGERLHAMINANGEKKLAYISGCLVLHCKSYWCSQVWITVEKLKSPGASTSSHP